jgi:hypothetical protein
MTKRNTIIVLISFAVISLSSLFIWGVPNTDKNWKREYNRFYNSDIEGIVEEVGIKYHGTFFKIKGIKEGFVFYPYTDKELNDDKIFEHLTKAGDSLIKPSRADTLTLITRGKQYRYTFQHGN